MTEIINTFEHIAPFLTDPLVLIGFVLMLTFYIHTQLLKAGIIPKLNNHQGSKIIEGLLRYGFLLSILVILLGFGLKYYETYTNIVAKTSNQAVETSFNISQIVTNLSNKHEQNLQAKDEQIKALTEAVTALSKGQGVDAGKSELNAALAALEQGNTTLAKALFAKTAEKTEQQAKQGAEALRNLGALAFLDNSQEALQAYRRATQLEPDNADNWNQLGRLLYRTGELTAAIDAYNKVLTLGEIQHDKEKIAWAYGNLGSVYRTYGNFDKAIEFHHKSLNLNLNLGHKENMANNYGNLGVAYEAICDFDKALEFHHKAIDLFQELGNKKGMALDYVNLGVLYKNSGDLDNAIVFYQKALFLNIDLGNKYGMAAAYGNLGNLYNNSGDLEKAMEFNQKALSLDQDIDNKEGIAADYSGLGRNYEHQGDLEKANELHQKALSLHQKLDSKDGMAMDYGNLGYVAQLQGNNSLAKHYYQLGLKLFKSLNSSSAQDMQASLDALQ